MVTHRVAGAPLDLIALREDLAVPGDLSSQVLADTRRAITSLVLPDADETQLPLVTLDPPGSRDLDQAVHISRDGDGFLVHYAIADVAAFVEPGSPTDEEAQRRGQTLYFPDLAVPMLPPALSRDAASLLPDQLRPAVLWRIALDGTGNVRTVDLGRARVRNRQQLDYPTMQRAMDSGTLPDAIALLPQVGRLRADLARQRHAIDLDLPDQQVERDARGWRIELRVPTAIEDHNAEISLLTGMCAAALMLEHGYGILRTVPPPDDGAVRALRRAARALGLPWPHGEAPGDVLAALDHADPRSVVLIEHAATLLRGAAYQSFDGAPPRQPSHAGIGAPYTHATAPLRRLVDRYVSEICLAHAAGRQVPDWVRVRVPELPATMAKSDQRAHAVDRAVVDATEAWLLQDRVGASFWARVIDADEHAGTVMLDEPPVQARCQGTSLAVGEHIQVRLVEADVASRTVRFESGAQIPLEEGDGRPA
jgi:exoribonuclease R